MEVRYFVAFTLHNSENGGWAYKIELSTNRLDAAKKKYHEVLQTYLDSKTFDHVQAFVYDSFGNIIMNEWDQTEIPKHTIVFIDYDGRVISSNILAKGDTITPPANPRRKDYTFTGWSPEFESVVSKDVVYVAQYKEDVKYNINFVNYDGAILSSSKVAEGETITIPPIPYREGYVFTGWSPEVKNTAESDAIYVAMYDIIPEE